MTSSANVELVRAICADWARGDYSRVDWVDPEMEFVIPDGPTPGRWTGTAGIAEAWAPFLSAWDGFHTVIEDFRALDDERVLVMGHFGGRGKTSGVEVGRTGGTVTGVFHIRDGKAIKLVTYFDRERALADFGVT